MIKFFWISLSFFTFAASAGLRQYSASVESSLWEVTTSNRITCTLAHTIPGYGEALFTSMASKQLNLEFELDMYRLPKTFGVAAVYATPPAWMPGEMQRPIADMTLRQQYNGDLPEKAAWTMLTELEKGYWPTIFYQDWYNDNDRVAVGLNASNFVGPYHDFSRCVANLLPYSFEDISYTVLSYKKNSTELTKYSQKRLAMIGEYLKEDKELEMVLLDGYSDSYGGRYNNLQLSVQRANKVRDYFNDIGVEAERVEVVGHGERHHIAPNDNSLSRAKNRRVVVRMSKP